MITNKRKRGSCDKARDVGFTNTKCYRKQTGIHHKCNNNKYMSNKHRSFCIVLDEIQLQCTFCIIRHFVVLHNDIADGDSARNKIRVKAIPAPRCYINKKIIACLAALLLLDHRGCHGTSQCYNWANHGRGTDDHDRRILALVGYILKLVHALLKAVENFVNLGRAGISSQFLQALCDWKRTFDNLSQFSEGRQTSLD